MKKYGFYEPDLKKLYEILSLQGYTIVEYSSVCNDENVENIIKGLNLSEFVKKTRGFTYVSEDLRLVFVNEDLTEEEKLVVLLHEQGHIFCDHFSKLNVIGNDVIQENEANEFSHYILKPGVTEKLIKNKKKVIGIAVSLFVILFACVTCGYVAKQMSYYEEYYVTKTGTKYHLKDCGYVKNKDDVLRLTKDDYNAGVYEACKKCVE